MEAIIDIFKVKGIRPTQQRLAVYEALRDKNTHLTAEEIYERIKLHNPVISLATVYTILDLFKSKLLAAEIRINFDKSCFQARVDAHHHFFCRSCQTIIDIDMEPCRGLKNKEVEGHSIESMQGYFYGLCRQCREK